MKEKAQAHQDWLPQAWATREAFPKGKQWVIGELFRVFIEHLAGESKAVWINPPDDGLRKK